MVRKGIKFLIAFLQSLWRGRAARQRYMRLKLNKAATAMQSAWRGFTCRRAYQLLLRDHKAASHIQSCWLMRTARRLYLRTQAAAVKIQRTWRSRQKAEPTISLEDFFMASQDDAADVAADKDTACSRRHMQSCSTREASSRADAQVSRRRAGARGDQGCVHPSQTPPPDAPRASNSLSDMAKRMSLATITNRPMQTAQPPPSCSDRTVGGSNGGARQVPALKLPSRHAPAGPSIMSQVRVQTPASLVKLRRRPSGENDPAANGAREVVKAGTPRRDRARRMKELQGFHIKPMLQLWEERVQDDVSGGTLPAGRRASLYEDSAA